MPETVASLDALGRASTLFTSPPDWRWLIVGYFFVGGLAGGSYFLAALMDLVGSPRDRALARLGYFLAFPLVVICGVLLIVDLGRPERFWHMLVRSQDGWPMFKSYSPMSIGAWALVVFGALSFLSLLAALRDAGRLRWAWPARLRRPGVLGGVVTVLGGLTGLFLTGYTGVLLAVSNRPIWADTPLVGMAFVISSASTAASLLLLVSWTRRRAVDGLPALRRFHAGLLVLELCALVALVASLGSLARIWLSPWGAVLALGVVGLGIVVPLLLLLRPRSWSRADIATPAAAVLVLIGGFLFRMVIVLSIDAIGRLT